MKDRIKRLEDRKKFFTIQLEWFMLDSKNFSTEIKLCEIQLNAIEKEFILIEIENGKTNT